ncbi:MAG: C4-dicarboxylate ABC transporter permease [Alphaproteobacteria bacterium BRH_c36]|nr:MAG: C4-dicarboxylate ABC transporter permease [Alphaproteobacteria bacterium BRH_c36]
MIASLSRTLEWILESITVGLMIFLTIVVIVAVLFRISGNSLSWYDEVAEIFLAWITYYGAALAALKRRHIGFDTVLLALPLYTRMAALIFGEVVVIGFFVIMAWAGWQVLQVLQGDYLVSLTWVPVQITQSVIPIGAVLFIVCEVLSLPQYWRMTARGKSIEHAEIEEEVETELKKAGTN